MASAETIDDVHASYCYKGQATRIVCNESCEACGPERYGCHRTGQGLLKRLPSQRWETESWVDVVRGVLAGELFEPKAGRGTAGARLS